MRFNNHFILAITAAVLVASQLQDSLFTTQDLSDDLLLSPLDTSTNDLEVSLFDNNNNNNNNDDDDMLFADPSGTDPSFDSSFQLAGAESCPSNDGHPPARLRSRDGYCPPNGQSSPSSLDGFVNNLGIFGDPGQVEEKLQNAAGASTDEKVDEQEPCPSYRPFHLCCESEGSKPYPLLYGTRRTLYKTMENCETGEFSFMYLFTKHSSPEGVRDHRPAPPLLFFLDFFFFFGKTRLMVGDFFGLANAKKPKKIDIYIYSASPPNLCSAKEMGSLLRMDHISDVYGANSERSGGADRSRERGSGSGVQGTSRRLWTFDGAGGAKLYYVGGCRQR